MAIKEVRITVDGVQQVVIFDGTLQAFVATIPPQADDLYDVKIEVEDFSGGITISSSFFSIPEGELVRFEVKDRSGNPVEGVKITAFHQNPVGGANFGAADFRDTGFDGLAFLHLGPANYNMEIEKKGFKKQILLDFPVLGGLVLFDNAGGTAPDTRTVKDPAGTPLETASIKVVQVGQPPASALVVHQQSSVAGEWTASLKPNTNYEVTVEKSGFDLVRAVVQNA